MLRFFALLLLLAPAFSAHAQDGAFYDQDALQELMDIRAENIDDLPDVYYDYYVLRHREGNTVMARNIFYSTIGDGDAHLGKKRSLIVELLNRRLMSEFELGDTIVVPTDWNLDFRAYSPFPRYYIGARDLDKLFIIHKEIQAFAAYENGVLTRWGPVNTGAKESPTPNGRFNFNWREPYRVSSLSPSADEPWEMYWVLNFHLDRGIHIHQYAFPTGGPTSHGCVRLIDADARWIYDWADTWQTPRGDGFGSIGLRIQEQGTTVLVLGEDPVDIPHPFTYRRRYPILVRIDLPSDPYEVEPGTAQQVQWDRLRARTSSR
jgi:hypothetical protein